MRYRLSFLVSILLFNLFIFTPHCESRRPFACDPANATMSGFPFCKACFHTSYRVLDLLQRLTLQEKIRLLVNNAAPVDRLGILGYEWWSEALHGVSNVGPGTRFRKPIPAATSFPQVITTAASFNASLWGAIGQVVSDEARAMYNAGLAGLTYWSPNVNVFRDPRWGRGQETPGEDPLVVARYGVRYVKELQGNCTDNLKVAACCKHYTAYDLDSWHRVNRFTFNAVVSKQDLEETYNVPFKACVTDGNVASVMCSYNQVNGKPTCADPDLLRHTIRDQWKLNGYIVSDCDSVDVFYRNQHYTATPEDAATMAIKAGLDLDCGPFLAVHTEKAIQSGKLNITDIDFALTNTLTVQMRLGMFDGPTNQPYSDLGPKDVCTPAHQKLALEAAQQGIVLLKNINNALPLSTKRHRTVAVIGPNSDVTATMIGNYAGIPCGYTTPLQGISTYAKTISDPGCRGVSCPDTNHDGAVAASRQSDATVLVMGLDQSLEREGLDRENLLLPGRQMELVSTVARASKGPVVLILMSGGPIDVTFAKNDPNIAAIFWVGYPGQAGGAAIADVLFGTANPGGKLPMTWYPQDYVVKVPMTDMRMRPDPKTGYPGRTYKFYNGKPVYEFGHGLSYTKFRHRSASGPTKHSIPITTSSKAFKNASGKAVRVSHMGCEGLAFGMQVEVENVGEMDGAHTVMVFATSPSGERKLVAFEKVHVVAGARKQVGVSINTCDHMSIVDGFGIRRIEMGEHKMQIGDDLVHTVTLYNT